MLKTQPEKVRRVLIDEKSDNERLREVRKSGQSRGSRHRSQLLAIGSMRFPAGARHQGVIVDLAESRAWDDAALRRFRRSGAAGRDLLFLYLDEVQDPHNLGACMRSAEAAGVDAVIAPRKRAASLTPDSPQNRQRGGRSAAVRAGCRSGKDPGVDKSYGIRVIATADGARESMYEADLSGSMVLVLAGRGARRDPADAQPLLTTWSRCRLRARWRV